MTLHCNRNFAIKTNRRTNFQILFWYLICFGQFLCPSSGVIECTFDNSWWWAEKLPETCSVPE